MASHWVVADTFYGIVLVLAVLIWIFVIEFWPIILSVVILILAIGLIAYYGGKGRLLTRLITDQAVRISIPHGTLGPHCQHHQLSFAQKFSKPKSIIDELIAWSWEPPRP